MIIKRDVFRERKLLNSRRNCQLRDSNKYMEAFTVQYIEAPSIGEGERALLVYEDFRWALFREWRFTGVPCFGIFLPSFQDYTTTFVVNDFLINVFSMHRPEMISLLKDEYG